VASADVEAVREALSSSLASAAPDGVNAWLAETVAAVSRAPGSETMARAFSSVARRLRDVRYAATSARLRASAFDLDKVPSIVTWDASRAARTLLLLAATRNRSPEACVDLIAGLFRHGDNNERAALLSALALLPFPEAYVEIAVEACRTNVVDVFEAIACDNPYPSSHFSDASFNQMVLKALFLGVAVDRIVGWRTRVNAELARMVADYAEERRSAGRRVPDDVERIRRAVACGQEGR